MHSIEALHGKRASIFLQADPLAVVGNDPLWRRMLDSDFRQTLKRLATDDIGTSASPPITTLNMRRTHGGKRMRQYVASCVAHIRRSVEFMVRSGRVMVSVGHCNAVRFGELLQIDNEEALKFLRNSAELRGCVEMWWTQLRMRVPANPNSDDPPPDEGQPIMSQFIVAHQFGSAMVALLKALTLFDYPGGWAGLVEADWQRDAHGRSNMPFPTFFLCLFHISCTWYERHPKDSWYGDGAVEHHTAFLRAVMDVVFAGAMEPEVLPVSTLYKPYEATGYLTNEQKGLTPKPFEHTVVDQDFTARDSTATVSGSEFLLSQWPVRNVGYCNPRQGGRHIDEKIRFPNPRPVSREALPQKVLTSKLPRRAQTPLGIQAPEDIALRQAGRAASPNAAAPRYYWNEAYRQAHPTKAGPVGSGLPAIPGSVDGENMGFRMHPFRATSGAGARHWAPHTHSRSPSPPNPPPPASELPAKWSIDLTLVEPKNGVTLVIPITQDTSFASLQVQLERHGKWPKGQPFTLRMRQPDGTIYNVTKDADLVDAAASAWVKDEKRSQLYSKINETSALKSKLAQSGLRVSQRQRKVAMRAVVDKTVSGADTSNVDRTPPQLMADGAARTLPPAQEMSLQDFSLSLARLGIKFDSNSPVKIPTSQPL